MTTHPLSRRREGVGLGGDGGGGGGGGDGSGMVLLLLVLVAFFGRRLHRDRNGESLDKVGAIWETIGGWVLVRWRW